MMRVLAIFLICAATLAQAEEWRRLDGAGIAEALTDRVLIYENARQDFRASGRTLYVFGGRDSWGYWRVEGDRYCSLWPPSDLWACYALEQQGARFRFVGDADDITEAVYDD